MEPVPDRRKPSHLLRHLLPCEPGRLSHAGDPDDVLGPRPETAFLAAPDEDRLDPNAGPDVERPVPVGPPSWFEERVRRSMPSRSTSIGILPAASVASTWRYPSPVMDDLRHFPDRLNRPDLVVRVVDRCDNGPGRDRRTQGVEVEYAIVVDRDLRERKPALLEVFCRVQD